MGPKQGNLTSSADYISFSRSCSRMETSEVHSSVNVFNLFKHQLDVKGPPALIAPIVPRNILLYVLAAALTVVCISFALSIWKTSSRKKTSSLGNPASMGDMVYEAQGRCSKGHCYQTVAVTHTFPQA